MASNTPYMPDHMRSLSGQSGGLAHMEMHDLPADASAHLMLGDLHKTSPPMEPMDKRPMMTSEILSHTLAPNDPDNPMNWPLHRRIYASSVAWAFSFAVAYALTTYTAGVNDVVKEFGVSMTESILPFSLFLWGIAFAPIWTPHAAARLGRSKIYLVSLFVCALFILGASLSTSFAGVAVCRFFAGLTGGPCLVLVEGTFADIWSADTTNTYYAALGLSSYLGAACGPIVGGFVVAAKGWRWLEYVTLLVMLVVLAFGFGIPESYGREIPRRRARRLGQPLNQPPAESGDTIGQMIRITVVNPIIMFVYEPVVIMITWVLGINFAVVFQWFITVPVALNSTYGFDVQQAGLAFFSAIVGAVCAALLSVLVEQIFYHICATKKNGEMIAIEYRLIPAMYGGFAVAGAMFWVGFSASPNIHYIVPILGTAAYVFGNVSVLIALIPYIFDAYPPAGTLGALTLMASFRLLAAGALPLGIIPMFMALTPPWALSVWGFIGIAEIPIPFILFFFGAKMRARSKFSRTGATMGATWMPIANQSHMTDVAV